MLGHKLFQTLRLAFPKTYCTIRGSVTDKLYKNIDLFQSGAVIENFDAMNWSGVRQILSQFRPGVIINCIGVVKQRPEAKDYLKSIYLNALLPHQLAELCQEWGGRLIHFSTDCVFSGRKGNYVEDDPSDADDLYGRTKFLGEVTGPHVLTLRTSMIGRELQNFQSLLEWFLGQNHKHVHGFTRAYYSGVTTNYLADLMVQIIDGHPGLAGLYQVTGQTITKYNLLCLLRDAYNLSIDIVPDDAYFCDRSMLGDKFHQATGLVCPSWEKLVAQLASDTTPYEKWRKSCGAS